MKSCDPPASSGERDLRKVFTSDVTVNRWLPGSIELFTEAFLRQPDDLPPGDATSVADTMTLPADLPPGDGIARGRARVHAHGQWREMPSFDRASVVGAGIDGPALIVEDYSTLYLPESWRIAAVQGGDLVARRT